jgi:hypothetical protein
MPAIIRSHASGFSEGERLLNRNSGAKRVDTGICMNPAPTVRLKRRLTWDR